MGWELFVPTDASASLVLLVYEPTECVAPDARMCAATGPTSLKSQPVCQDKLPFGSDLRCQHYSLNRIIVSVSS